MSKAGAENDKVEQLLSKVSLPELPDELKGRVTKAARGAWHESSPHIPWRVPVLRLAASAAAAVIIVTVANYANDRALAHWRSGGLAVIGRQLDVDLEAVPETPYGPVLMRLAIAARRSTGPDKVGLFDYLERFRQVLDEVQYNGSDRSPAPVNGPTQSLLTRPAFHMSA